MEDQEHPKHIIKVFDFEQIIFIYSLSYLGVYRTCDLVSRDLTNHWEIEQLPSCNSARRWNIHKSYPALVAWTPPHVGWYFPWHPHEIILAAGRLPIFSMFHELVCMMLPDSIFHDEIPRFPGQNANQSSLFPIFPNFSRWNPHVFHRHRPFMG